MNEPLRPRAFMGALRISRKLRRDPKLRRIVEARLIAAGLGRPCAACGGSGVFAGSKRDGGRCYACNARGTVAPALTPETLKICRRKAAQAALDACEAAARERRAALGILPAVVAAWDATGISRRFSFSRAARHRAGEEHAPEDARIADLNDGIAEAVDRIERLHRELEGAIRSWQEPLADRLAAELRQAAPGALAHIEVTARRIGGGAVARLEE